MTKAQSMIVNNDDREHLLILCCMACIMKILTCNITQHCMMGHVSSLIIEMFGLFLRLPGDYHMLFHASIHFKTVMLVIYVTKQVG